MISRRKKQDKKIVITPEDVEASDLDFNTVLLPRKKPLVGVVPSSSSLCCCCCRWSTRLWFWLVQQRHVLLHLHRKESKARFTWRIVIVSIFLAFTIVFVTWRTPIPLDEFITEESGFHPEWHPTLRSERFPSIEERLKIYMSNWYLPPCDGRPDGTSDERIRYYFDFSGDDTAFPDVVLKGGGVDGDGRLIAKLDTKLRPDVPVVLWQNALWKETLLWGTVETCHYYYFTKSYCPDIRNIAEQIIAMDEQKRKSLEYLPPFIGQYGDRATVILHNSRVPIIKKYRHAIADESYLRQVTSGNIGLDCSMKKNRRDKLVTVVDKTLDSSDLQYSPIIMALNTGRHLDPKTILQVLKYETPWERKWNMAVWRGVITGREGEDGITFAKDCHRIPRCRFVRDNLDSNLLDVGVSFQLKSTPIDRAHRRKYIKGTMSLTRMMRYKAIVIIEGNDIASGLKWALYSRSVVLMAPPTKTSFAMEEILQPWVHYIPLQEDLSNAEEMMQWVIDHDEESRRIAERGTLFIHDLLFHSDSIADNEYIQEEILQRYMRFFVHAPP